MSSSALLKKITQASLMTALGFSLLFSATSASAQCVSCVNAVVLPTGPVPFSETFLNENPDSDPATSPAGFIRVTLAGNTAGTTLANQTVYTGWCGGWHGSYVENFGEDGFPLYSTYSPQYPAGAKPRPTGNTLNMVNYILNHKQGTVKDVQNAIWLIMTGEALSPSTTAFTMASAAQANPLYFPPSVNGVMAVLYAAGPAQLASTNLAAINSAQNMFIEVKTPNLGGDGGSNLILACPGVNALAGSPYSSSLVASLGTAPYSYSILSGSLPSGLVLNASTGAITGVPGAPGTASFTGKVVDSSGASATKTAECNITVQPAGFVSTGDTATIGFWNNKNGQSIILALNGPVTLANWLASSFPLLYGPASANNLTGKTNADVAALFKTLFKVSGQKTQAQILSAALATYTTDTSLSGASVAALRAKFGFNSSTGGTGAKLFNVGSNGTAIGLSNNTSYSVYYLLTIANSKMAGGFNANAFNAIFDGINQKGDII